MSVEERATAIAGLSSSLESLKCFKWSYSRPPLMWAVHSGLLQAVKDLLTGASPHDPNTCDTVGRSSLHECAALIRSGEAVLAEAAVPIAVALMESGARVNHTSISGRAPLHELFCANQDEKVSSFRVFSEDIAAVCATRMSSGDACTVNMSRKNLLKVLLQNGADTELMDRQGLGPIHYCARENNADCLLEILMSNANEFSLTRLLQSHLHIACKAGAVDTANLLCRWDADHIPTKNKRLSTMQQVDGQGKLPIHLLPHSISPKCLESLWGASRAGDLSRWSLMPFLIFMKEIILKF